MSTIPMMMMIISPLMATNASSWILIWVFLESSTMGFTCFFLSKKNNWSNQSETMVKYFLIQAMASSMILVPLLHQSKMNNDQTFFPNFMNENLITMALLMKLGMIPFHFWMPPLGKSMKWWTLVLMLTWQKIIPLYMITTTQHQALMYSAILSSMISTMSLINNNNVKEILIFSSMSHFSWILIMSLINLKFMWTYFVMYTSISALLVKVMKTNKTEFMNQEIQPTSKFNLITYLLSIAGMPPTFGFFPKWAAAWLMMENKMKFTLLILLTMVMINLFIYMQISFNILMKPKSSKKNISAPQSNFSSAMLTSIPILMMMV